MSRSRRARWLLLFALAASACGGGGPATYPVSGTVSLDGTPIADGSITFRPVDAHQGPVRVPVKEGKFEANVPAGAMKVEVNAARPGPEVKDMGPTMVEYIPPQYHGPDTTLQAEIKPEGQAPLEFKLTSN